MGENTITIRSWSDPVVEQLGHEPQSGYVERFWLPILGPTATLLYRRFGQQVLGLPPRHEFTYDRDDLAKAFGVGAPAFDRAVDRLGFKGAARWVGGVFEVRRQLPDVPMRFCRQLPDSLLAELSERVQVRAAS